MSESVTAREALGPVWPRLGVHVVFLAVARADEVLTRVLLESYEGVGVARAHDPTFSSQRTLLSLLVAPDFAADACRLLDALRDELAVELYRPSPQRIRELQHALRLRA